jgi:subtilase family serine protease
LSRAWRKFRALVIETLESRTLLDASFPAGCHVTPIADPHFLSGSNQPGSTSPNGLAPNQIRAAYGLGTYGTSGVLSNGIDFGQIAGDGRGQTIAIVDAFDDPNALADLNAFSNYYSLPTLTASGSGGSGSPTFQKLNETGGTSPPGTDPSGPYQTTGTSDWEVEESLDIEWAHSIAPMANIILFEAGEIVHNVSTCTDADLYTTVKTAANTPGVVAVSMSWSEPEFAGESSYDSTSFTTPPGHVGGSATLGGTGLAH